MAKKRVHELAKEFGIDNKTMLEKLAVWGYDVKTHSSALEDDQIKTITEKILAERRPAAPSKMGGAVVIRRSKPVTESSVNVASVPVVEAVSAAKTPIVEKVIETPAPIIVAEPVVEPVHVVTTKPVEKPTEKPVVSAPVVAAPVPTPVVSAPTQSPTANKAVLVNRQALGFVPPVKKPLPAAQVRPAAVTSSAPAAAVRPAQAQTQATPASQHRPSSHSQRQPSLQPFQIAQQKAAQAAAQAANPVSEVAATPAPVAAVPQETKLVGGVQHYVVNQTQNSGRPTAQQAVLISRPTFITTRKTPVTQPQRSFPMAPGIRSNNLPVREGGFTPPRAPNPGEVMTDGRDARMLSEADNKKLAGRRTTRDDQQSFSKQDLLTLAQSRSIVHIDRKKRKIYKRGEKTLITQMDASKKVISIEDTIGIRELSERMGVKSMDLIKKLNTLTGKMMMITQAIDFDTAELIVGDYGWKLNRKGFEISDFVTELPETPEDMKPRPPVITVMGHVDHGKTSLLDALRSANVAAGEAGGITQHIGAYTVTLPGKGDITFLDTPGHEAFSAMRNRGAQVTDAVILVVAADDGVQPQTIESIKHAKEAGVPIIVAINKIDKPGTNPDTIKGSLASHGLQAEDWGGDVPMVPVSARQKTNLDLLLENVLLQTELLELSYHQKRAGKGAIIESKLDKGRGVMSTVLVQDGSLKVGDAIVAGVHWGKVRTMVDEKGKTHTKVLAGYPVQVVGLSGAPDAGEELFVVPDEMVAKKIADHRANKAREIETAKQSRMSLDDLVKKNASDAPKELVVIVKADVQGSAQAVSESLRKQSGKKVVVKVVMSGVGSVTESDIRQAKASKAMVIGFNARPDSNAQAIATQSGVKIKNYSLIYELLDDVRLEMEGLLEPIYKERPLGRADVIQVFSVSKIGSIAGCRVVEGKANRAAQVRVMRDRKMVFVGKVSSLKRVKDDVREVVAGTECGIGIEGYNDMLAGDVFELFEIETIRPKLD